MYLQHLIVASGALPELKRLLLMRDQSEVQCHTAGTFRNLAAEDQSQVRGADAVVLIASYTVEPLVMDTVKSGRPPYNGHTVHPLPLYCHYISTSEEGTTSEQWTKCSSPTCPLFGCSTVYVWLYKALGIEYSVQ